jgi:REP element-mobilizing transposase RayT
METSAAQSIGSTIDTGRLTSLAVIAGANSIPANSSRARIRSTSSNVKSVDSAIREVCAHRSWFLHALNVRTNHVHIVVSIGEEKPERALNAFKAYGTRRMRQDGNWQESHSPWADKGSKRRLWNERSLALAVDYVINGQGGDLPDLD